MRRLLRSIVGRWPLLWMRLYPDADSCWFGDCRRLGEFWTDRADVPPLCRRHREEY